MSDSKWKQIVGKSVPEEAYVNDFELRECYLKTMKLTTINTNGNGKISELSKQVTELNKQISEQITKLSNQIETKDKEIAELKKKIDLIWNEFSPFYSIAANTEDDSNKIGEKVEDFIRLLKETSDKQSEYIDNLWNNRDSKRPILPYTDIIEALAKELYRIKNRYKDELKELAMKPLENEAKQQKDQDK